MNKTHTAVEEEDEADKWIQGAGDFSFCSSLSLSFSPPLSPFRLASSEGKGLEQCEFGELRQDGRRTKKGGE